MTVRMSGGAPGCTPQVRESAAARCRKCMDCPAIASVARMNNHVTAAPSSASGTPPKASFLKVYFLLTYLALLANFLIYLRTINYVDGVTAGFAAAVGVTYALGYLLLAFLPVLAVHRLMQSGSLQAMRSRFPWLAGAMTCAAAVCCTSALQIFVFADGTIYRLYGWHVNGFVINLLGTPGGLESMGGDTATLVTFAGIAASYMVLQILLLAAALRGRRLGAAVYRWLPRRAVAVGCALALVLAVGERVTYAVAALTDRSSVLAASEAIPYYQPLSLRSLARAMGFKMAKQRSFRVAADTGELSYPLNPLTRVEHPRYNIVCLTVESLRADMLDPRIMPAASRFADRAVRFEQHYSAGNNTRHGMFGMFYGLYGSYWFSFLHQLRGPVLIDVLLEDQYQMSMYTSAVFTYPEFDRTIFVRIPPQQLHTQPSGAGWEKDRANVTELLDWIDGRDPERPFMAFMFFESPHARYFFPEESVIRPDYLPDFNYATMDLKNDIGRIKNRYINSCHHLDGQLQRILDHLEANHLLDSTIVLITGDHGEAFMEHGRWGHGSDFTEQQTRTPMILWIPGVEPRVVTRMTSHLDIPATLLPRLGVTNPASDYSLGFDMLGDVPHPYTVIADYSNLMFVDSTSKVLFPQGLVGFARHQLVTTRDDERVEDAAGVKESHREAFVQMVAETFRFRRR